MKRELTQLSNFAKTETIYEVHDKMELLCEKFEKNEKYIGFLAFLKTYELVTKEVLNKSLRKNYFKDVKKLRELDVIFAGLYFNPLNKFLKTNKLISPWKTSFKLMSENKNFPFVQMLVGISSHINADLPFALLRTNYDQRQDFLVINQILNKQIPALMNFLAFHENDLIAFGGLIFESFVLEEFHKIVIKWRLNSWKNYQKLKKDRRKIKELRAKTEQLNKNLIKIFLELEKFPNINLFLKEINKIEVLI